ncbi:MAG: MOSC domain-containing protein [Bacteroidetes bacterium]|nr:MOSC domain-containing protein [Bacteroidota bacterium]
MVLRSLHIYPIKSTHRVAQLRAMVNPWGLFGDRRWMIVDEHARFLTQREMPRMALIQAVPHDDGSLLLTATGHQYQTVSLPGEGADILEVLVWKDLVPARKASQKASEWLTSFLGRRVDLVYMHDPNLRQTDTTYAKPGTVVSFADGYPLLCTTEASLTMLNEKLPAPIPMERFRPNVVVSGGAPFEEDTWRRLRIGEVVFAVVKPCTRCTITTVDQETASRGKEPLRTLNSFRKRGGNVYFGENLVPENNGVIHRGDIVEVLEFDP